MADSASPRLAGGVSLRQLADGAGQVLPIGTTGRLAGPLVLVSLDGPTDPALLDAARAAAWTASCVLVGVRTQAPLDGRWHDLLDTLDLTLAPVSPQVLPSSCVAAHDPSAVARALQTAAFASPQASVALS